MPVGLTLDSGSVKAIVEALSSHHSDAVGDLAGDMCCHLGEVGGVVIGIGGQIISVAGVVEGIGRFIGAVSIIFKTSSSQ